MEVDGCRTPQRRALQTPSPGRDMCTDSPQRLSDQPAVLLPPTHGGLPRQALPLGIRVPHDIGFATACSSSRSGGSGGSSSSGSSGSFSALPPMPPGAPLPSCPLSLSLRAASPHYVPAPFSPLPPISAAATTAVPLQTPSATPTAAAGGSFAAALSGATAAAVAAADAASAAGNALLAAALCDSPAGGAGGGGGNGEIRVLFRARKHYAASARPLAFDGTTMGAQTTATTAADAEPSVQHVSSTHHGAAPAAVGAAVAASGLHAMHPAFASFMRQQPSSATRTAASSVSGSGGVISSSSSSKNNSDSHSSSNGRSIGLLSVSLPVGTASTLFSSSASAFTAQHTPLHGGSASSSPSNVLQPSTTSPVGGSGSTSAAAGSGAGSGQKRLRNGSEESIMNGGGGGGSMGSNIVPVHGSCSAACCSPSASSPTSASDASVAALLAAHGRIKLASRSLLYLSYVLRAGEQIKLRANGALRSNNARDALLSREADELRRKNKQQRKMPRGATTAAPMDAASAAGSSGGSDGSSSSTPAWLVSDRKDANDASSAESSVYSGSDSDSDSDVDAGATMLPAAASGAAGAASAAGIAAATAAAAGESETAHLHSLFASCGSDGVELYTSQRACAASFERVRTEWRARGVRVSQRMMELQVQRPLYLAQLTLAQWSAARQRMVLQRLQAAAMGADAGAAEMQARPLPTPPLPPVSTLREAAAEVHMSDAKQGTPPPQRQQHQQQSLLALFRPRDGMSWSAAVHNSANKAASSVSTGIHSNSNSSSSGGGGDGGSASSVGFVGHSAAGTSSMISSGGTGLSLSNVAAAAAPSPSNGGGAYPRNLLQCCSAPPLLAALLDRSGGDLSGWSVLDNSGRVYVLRDAAELSLKLIDDDKKSGVTQQFLTDIFARMSVKSRETSDSVLA